MSLGFNKFGAFETHVKFASLIDADDNEENHSLFDHEKEEIVNEIDTISLEKFEDVSE